jgi:hypothetical protein
MDPLRDPSQQPKLPRDLVFALTRRSGSLHRARGSGVVEARPTAKHGGVEAPAGDLPGAVDLELRHHRQSVHTGTERAQIP